jgi:hypothetical protein
MSGHQDNTFFPHISVAVGGTLRKITKWGDASQYTDISFLENKTIAYIINLICGVYVIL